jgi:segregation and condensation protein A
MPGFRPIANKNIPPEISPSHIRPDSPTTLPVDANDYKVRLEIFEGPLDLLLYLIKKDEVDIQAIAMERITRQYLDYINTFKLLNIDLASEFIVMAANLMYLKSRTLLPRVDQPPEEDAEEDDPRWELIRQLIEYKKFKDAAGFLSLRAIEQEGRFAHQPEPSELPAQEPAPLAEISIFDLIRAFQNVLKRFEESHDFGDIIDDRFTVSDKIDFLMEQFSPGETKQFEALFQSATTKAEVIVTFLALLELMKLNQFIVRQSSLLGTIAIERRDNSSAGGASLGLELSGAAEEFAAAEPALAGAPG